MILAEFGGRHTEAWIETAWTNIKGGLHPSADMLAIGAELDESDPGWRDADERILAGALPPRRLLLGRSVEVMMDIVRNGWTEVGG